MGGAAFQGRNGPVEGRAAHRRRVALLAILALARGRTVGRERIVGLLWPEQTASGARHLLSESLYVLRKELGADAFVSAGDEVGLNREVVRSDVEEFEAQVEAGRLEEAARLYRGPFLDGFFVADAPEFERWAEGERARLAAAHARAVECLAAAREGEGRHAEAAEWWRRLVALDPYDSRVGTRLMLALDAAGQRAAALWFAETHAAFLREELGVEPEDDFQELVERLRTEPVRVPLPPPVSPPAPYPPDGDRIGIAAPEPSSPARATGDTGGIDGSDSEDRGESEERARFGDEADPAGAARPGDAARAIDAAGPADGADAAHPADPVDADSADDPARAAGSDGLAESAESVGAVDLGRLDDAREAGGGGAGMRGTGGIEMAGARAVGRGDAAAVPAADVPGEGAGARRRWLRPAHVAAMAGVAAAAALGIALLAPSRTEIAEAPRPAGHDPRRIAVLYFDDHTQGGELGYLANGLTEMLIHELSQVEALDVVSRNGVKQYRDTAVPFDSLVADLRVGSVVEGSVQRSGSDVRVTVQLVDAATNSHLESRTVVHPLGDVFALEDALADSVSGFLRRRLGQHVKLRRIRGETRSPLAWRWVMEAEQARDDAARLLRTGEPREAARQLARADSLLAGAEREDPAWPRPTVLRGWVAYHAFPLAPSGRAREDAALAFAERALARAPADALALELRGTMRFARVAAATDGTAPAAPLGRAEADLRAAVAAEPGLARAWGTLSQLLRLQGRLADSDAAARRALDEDAYLDGADLLLNRLFLSSLFRADYAQADSLCRGGARRYRGDWKFVECRLILLRADAARPPDAALAARLLGELDRVDPPDRARREGRAYTPLFRQAVAAAVVARAGDADSARAMLARARRAAGNDPELRISLAYDEAYVQQVLGAPDSARALLEWAFTRRPSLREFAARDPLFRGLPGPASSRR